MVGRASPIACSSGLSLVQGDFRKIVPGDALSERAASMHRARKPDGFWPYLPTGSSGHIDELLQADPELHPYAEPLAATGANVLLLAELSLADLRELLPNAPVAVRVRLLCTLRRCAAVAERPAGAPAVQPRSEAAARTAEEPPKAEIPSGPSWIGLKLFLESSAPRELAPFESTRAAF
eukprot:1132334-Prymnesium_polylepis.2